MRGREEAALEVIHAADGEQSAIQHHESRQIIRRAAQPVAGPRSHAGPSQHPAAGMYHKAGVGVQRGLAGQGADDAELIRTAADMREKVADWQAALPAGRKLPWAAHGVAIAVKLGGFLFDRKRLPMFRPQPWLGVKAIQMRHPAAHE